MATLKRTLQVKTKPMRGDDVKRLQTELRRRGWLAGRADGVYGTATAAAVYKAKLAFGYAKPDHVAGEVFWKYLTGVKRPTAAMQKAAAKRRHAVKTPAGATSSSSSHHRPTKADLAAAHEANVRAKAVRIMRLLLENEARVHYRQVRPMVTRSIDTVAELETRLRSGVSMDCSESSTLIAKLAGAKSPNPGHPFSDGVGYTGTMLHGPTIPKTQLRPGDFVIFGPGTAHHVCVVLAAGADPLLFSHGQEKGPIAIRLSVEARYQPATIRYRRLMV